MGIKFRNLKAEQARYGYTNEQMGQFLGMSRGSYETKLRNGKFYIDEIGLIIKLFPHLGYEYLFAKEGSEDPFPPFEEESNDALIQKNGDKEKDG